MRHTLVAAFATLTDANRTRGDLMARGIPREQIHAVGAESAEIHAYDAPYSTAEGSLDRSHHESKVAHFFRSLFGSEPHEEHRHHATAYPQAVQRGALVIAVDVDDEDQLLRARDALEYNGAIDIHERGAAGDTAAAHGYPGPSSPYAGATGGDSHLDKHFARPADSVTGGVGASGGLAGQVTPADSAATGSYPLGETASADIAEPVTADPAGHGIGSAAKRAGTDYPPTTATTQPTGAGTTGHGSSLEPDELAPGVGTGDPGPYRERICVIRRPS